MSVKVGAWNLYESLALPRYADGLTTAILQRDCDVMFLSDAYCLDGSNSIRGRDGAAKPEVAEAALQRLKSAGGYEAISVEYGDELECKGRYMVGLSRVALAGCETVQLGRRRALAMRLASGGDRTDGLRLLGVHFNDETENIRIAQAISATDYLESGHAAIIGDCNAMHGADRRSQLLAQPLAESLASHFPNEHIRSIGERIHQMAWGSTFRLLESRGFYDADRSHRPTFPSRLPVFHLDRCFISDDTDSYGFTVAPHNPGSDHRAIEVFIET